MHKFLYIHDRLPTAFVVNVDGRTLPVFQALVGGLIDVAVVSDPTILSDFFPTLPDGHTVDLIVNDEGLYNDEFRLNIPATFLNGIQLVGPVVVALSDRKTGDTIGLSDEMLTYLRNEFIGPYVDEWEVGGVDDHGGAGWNYMDLMAHVATLLATQVA